MPSGVYQHKPTQGLQKGHKINNGRKLSKEHKNKLSILKLGKPLSGATIAGRIKAQKTNSWGKWNKGIIRTEEQKKKISDTLKNKGIKPINRWEASGTDNSNWKGDEAGNSAMHSWIKRKLGFPKKCEHCGTTDDRMYHWSNKDHTYKRIILDWQRLCVPCHRKYDYAKKSVVRS